MSLNKVQEVLREHCTEGGTAFICGQEGLQAVQVSQVGLDSGRSQGAQNNLSMAGRGATGRGPLTEGNKLV